MARRTETKFDSGHMIWRLEHCEAVVLIDAWLQVKARIPQTEHWRLDFEHRFFERGDAVSERHLSNINHHLRRIGANEVPFDETNVGAYVRSGDKATWLQDRRHIAESLKSMDTARRSRFVNDAASDMAMLEPAHRIYEEWRKGQPGVRDEAPRLELSSPPQPQDQTADKAPRAAESSQIVAAMPTMPVKLAFDLLPHTTDPELKNQLVRVIAAEYGL